MQMYWQIWNEKDKKNSIIVYNYCLCLFNKYYNYTNNRLFCQKVIKKNKNIFASWEFRGIFVFNVTWYNVFSNILSGFQICFCCCHIFLCLAHVEHQSKKTKLSGHVIFDCVHFAAVCWQGGGNQERTGRSN